MGYSITLSPSVRETNISEGIYGRSYSRNHVTVGSERLLIAFQGFNNCFWITLYDNWWKAQLNSKIVARAAANASTSLEGGRGTFLDREARTCPWWSPTTTPNPALLSSLNTVPSKLTLSSAAKGGCHLTHWGPAACICLCHVKTKEIIHL